LFENISNKTDITTYINGKRIPSYNIGGRTIILIEDLNEAYGFTTYWDAEADKLKINWLPEKIALKNDSADGYKIDPFKTDDVLFKVNMGVEIDGAEFPILGSMKGDLSPHRTDETPVVYKGTVYFPAEALADYFNIIYKDMGAFITKKDDSQTWAHDAKYIYMHVDQIDSELYSWIESTKPENYPSGRNSPLVEPYGKNEPIKIRFARPMDENSLNKANIPVVREYYSHEDNTLQYKVISDKYNYFYDENTNELTISSNGEGLYQGDNVKIYLKNIVDSKGSKLEGLYLFMFYIK